MENIYEFKNSKYEKASIELKALAYDVLTSLENKEDTTNWVSLIEKVQNTLQKIDSNTKVKIETKEENIEPKIEESKEKEEINEVEEQPEQINNKKQFIKTTKKESKAIMVRPNQFQNLKKSKNNQENILIDLGLFPNSPKKEVTIEKQEPVKEIPDEVERKIEDLTVKANIYYNEGDTEKAQELYDEIKKLNDEYKNTK